MTRSEEITAEATRRLNLHLDHTTFAELTVFGSYMRFNMAIGGVGYPFEFEEWMNPDEWQAFVTDQEFNSPIYDNAVKPLFNHHLDNYHKTKRGKGRV